MGTDFVANAISRRKDEILNTIELFTLLPNFMEFDDDSMVMQGLRRDKFQRHGGLLDGAKLIDDTIFNMEHKQGKVLKFNKSYYLSTEEEYIVNILSFNRGGVYS